MYGAGSWVMTRDAEARLTKTQRRMLRSMFQYKRKVSPVMQAVVCSTTASRSNSSASDSSQEIEPEVDHEELEPWHEWAQRVTRQIESVMGKVGVTSWVETQRRKFFRWAGHVARYTDDRWTIQIMNWTPTTGRGRAKSHPFKRWSDELKKFSVLQCDTDQWQVIAQDREKWSRVETMFVNHS